MTRLNRPERALVDFAAYLETVVSKTKANGYKLDFKTMLVLYKKLMKAHKALDDLGVPRFLFGKPGRSK